MGYGQYSAGGGMNRTKAEMVETFESAQDPITWSRKGGKNRLHFKRQGGSEHFSLHETVVAEIAADRKSITFRDGGWWTPTTQTALHDAMRAFGLKPNDSYSHTPYVRVGEPAKPDVTTHYFRVPLMKGDREGTWALGPDLAIGERIGDLSDDRYMLRADTDSGNFALRWIPSKKRLVSDAGDKLPCDAEALLYLLFRVDALAKATSGRVCFRGDAMDAFGFSWHDHAIYPGQTSRTMMVGCHTFRTQDARALMRLVAGEYPVAAANAKRATRVFLRTKDGDPFGIKAADAAYRANVLAREAGRRLRADAVARAGA